MGSFVEFNDTLQITRKQGFPGALSLKRHLKRAFRAKDFSGKFFRFHSKEGARIYHRPPTRVFLVENSGGKWIYWGHALVIEQTIYSEKGKTFTRGKFRITEIYPPDYQRDITKRETDRGKCYF